MLDTLIGLGMLAVATTVFVYYTIWTFLVPFLDESHVLASLFPPREWAIRIPALLLVIGVGIVGTFIGSVLAKNEKKKQAKLAAKKSQ